MVCMEGTHTKNATDHKAHCTFIMSQTSYFLFTITKLIPKTDNVSDKN